MTYGGTTMSSSAEERAYRKVTWRLLPFLMLCYLVAYLDRVNIGFAKLQMLKDLGFSETVYGLGAGIFFIGYFFFEVPSNMILHRVGARLWIGAHHDHLGAGLRNVHVRHEPGHVLRLAIHCSAWPKPVSSPASSSI